jgi:hypothetical protein
MVAQSRVAIAAIRPVSSRRLLLTLFDADMLLSREDDHP